MTDIQLVFMIIGSNIAINTLMYIAINSRLGDVNSRIGDMNNNLNGRINDLDNSLRALIQSEVAGLREAILRVEGILDARLKHLEEREKS